ncbi:MAG: hypothetical protein ABIH50_01845 [bacterium]
MRVICLVISLVLALNLMLTGGSLALVTGETAAKEIHLDGDVTVIPLDGRTKIIKIVPYEVNTKILKDEFEVFRVQYAIIWTLLGAGLIYAVAKR